MVKQYVGFRMEEDLVARINHLAEELGTTKSAVMELLVEAGLTHNLEKSVSLFYSNTRKDGRKKV